MLVLFWRDARGGPRDHCRRFSEEKEDAMWIVYAVVVVVGVVFGVLSLASFEADA